MLPLALSAPGAPPDSGEEVMVAAGSPEGGDVEDGPAEDLVAEAYAGADGEMPVDAQSVRSGTADRDQAAKPRKSGARPTANRQSTSSGVPGPRPCWAG